MVWEGDGAQSPSLDPIKLSRESLTSGVQKESAKKQIMAYQYEPFEKIAEALARQPMRVTNKRIRFRWNASVAGPNRSRTRLHRVHIAGHQAARHCGFTPFQRFVVEAQPTQVR